VRFTIANTIFATMCSSFTNNLRLIIKDELQKKETFIIAGAAAVFSTIILQYVVIESNYTATIYNIIIIILMAYIIYGTLRKLRKNLRFKEAISFPKLLVTGISAGSIAALTGLGGGSLTIPMLNLWMKVDIKKAKAITYGTIFITSLVLTIVNILNEPAISIDHIHYGYVLLPIALPLSVGVIVASPLGMKVGERLSSKTITYIFLSIIIIVMVKKLIDLLA
jgi:uncharacterized membrane protein YfcA